MCSPAPSHACLVIALKLVRSLQTLVWYQHKPLASYRFVYSHAARVAVVVLQLQQLNACCRHDLEWRLLGWAWLTCILFVPELVCHSADIPVASMNDCPA